MAELDNIYAQQATASKNLTQQREKLEAEQTKLLQAHYADAIPLELMKQEQQRITRQICAIDKEIAGFTANRQQVEEHLAQALDLLEDCHKLYQQAPDHLKKMLNNVFFEQVLINPPETGDAFRANGTEEMVIDDGELVINSGQTVLNEDELVSTSRQFDKSMKPVLGDGDTNTNSPLPGQTNSANIQAIPHINPPFNLLGNPMLRAEIFNTDQNEALAGITILTQRDNGQTKQAQNMAHNPQNLNSQPNNQPQTPDTTKQKSPTEKHHSGGGSDMRVMVGLNHLDSNLLRPLLAFRRELIASGGDMLQPAANEPKKARHITHQTRLKLRQQKQAALRYAAGEPVKTICTDFNIHRSTLHDICKRLGVEREQASQRAAQKNKVRELYQDGYTLADIAGRFNVSPGTIRRMLEDLGVGIRPRGRRRVAQVA